jgi:sigma-B regulation protein RsbU (phosphoserine phosphatase)
VPLSVRQALGETCAIVNLGENDSLAAAIEVDEMAVVCPNGLSQDPQALSRMVEDLDSSPAVAIFLLPEKARDAWKEANRPAGAVLWISDQAGPAEIAAKLEAASQLEPTIRNLKAALQAEQDEGRRLEILNEEVKLAARLQRDFLPRSFPEVGTARFSVLFKPASFVSGDIYDVVRLDETHIGFYVADAVGHGMPAALLTMFIKKGLQTKRILDNSYEIISPADSLGELNTSICDQNLSSCQFCTAVYCVLDTATGELVYTRAGHPEPILLRCDGRTEALDSPGSLLGVFPEAQFQTSRVTMNPGDRLILYSDGAEAYARGEASDGHAELLEFLEELRGLDKPALEGKLSDWVDHVRQLSREEDDITLLTLDL